MGGAPLEKNPDTVSGQPSAKELSATLRDTTISEILHYTDKHWNDQTVRISIANAPALLRLPSDWHGATKHGRENAGDAIVLFGSNLVEPIEGSRLSSDAFVDGLHTLHFIFEDGNGTQLTDSEASRIISSDTSCEIVSLEEEKPVMRAIKNDDEGKIIIEIRNGSISPVMKELTALGNDPHMDKEKKLRYRNAVNDCLGGFCAKGATAVRKRLDLFEVKRLTYFDDCFASGATIFGDQEVDAAMGRSHDHMLEEIRVSVASTQGITLAVKRSLDRHIPLLVRAGALSYGLGNRAIGTNYLINTQPEMLDHGLFTVGDMGDNLSTGREGLVHPHVRLYRPRQNRSNNETRIYLGGGLAMLELWEAKIMERKKDPDSYVCVLQASRINPPPGEDGYIHDWGVLLNGKTLPVFEQLT